MLAATEEQTAGTEEVPATSTAGDAAPATAVGLQITSLINHHALQPKLHAIRVVRWDILLKSVGREEKRCVRY